jgi:hypothetical protein
MFQALRMLVLAAVIVGAGCAKQDVAPSGELSQLGKQFLLSEEPEGAVGILDYREAATETQSVTLLGKIGGGTPVWSPESAMFLITDPTHALEDESGHVCHGDNCPFCKGKTDAKQAQAIAMLTTPEGKVPPVDARKLLPLAEGQLVVVQGRPETNAVGQLVVHVRGIYLR